MMMAEAEAKGKLCPKMSTSVRGIDAASVEYIMCCASECMAWRWQMVSAGLDHPFLDEKKPTDKGYCGAFGKPAT